MAHGNHNACRLDEHMVSGEPHPARSGSAPLSQRVDDGWQATEGLVVGLGVVGGNDRALDRRQQWASEAWEPVGWFGRTSVVNEIGAVRPESSTGMKSIAYDVPNRVVP